MGAGAETPPPPPTPPGEFHTPASETPPPRRQKAPAAAPFKTAAIPFRRFCEIRLARLCAQSIKLPRRVSDARVFYPETASWSREKFEPPNFTRDAKLPSGHFPFSFEPKPLALRRVLNHHAIRSATASLCQNATRVVSVPTHGPGRRLSIATPVPRHESERHGTAARATSRPSRARLDANTRRVRRRCAPASSSI